MGIDAKFIDEIPDEIKSILVVANELSIEQHINTQSLFQSFIDGGISKTINFT